MSFHTNFHFLGDSPYDGNSQEKDVYSATPDDTLFIQISLAYSLNHGEMYKSKEFEFGITNGASWYVLYGGLQVSFFQKISRSFHTQKFYLFFEGLDVLEEGLFGDHPGGE